MSEGDDAARQPGGLAADSHGRDDERAPLVLLHGLTYDRRQWDPVLAELAVLDPDRRVLRLDLPGHGDSPGRDSYDTVAVADVVHDAVTAEGLDAPVIVGHSLGAVIATIYAARHPARRVVNLDQPLLVGGFREVLRRAEPVLRSGDWRQVWDQMTAGMGIDQLLPAAQELVRTRTTPRQDLLLGYWNEVLAFPADHLTELRTRDLAAIRDRCIGYDYVTGTEPKPAYRSWLESALPDVRITVLPGGGHFPHLAWPAEVAGILARN
ncbi:alpha/beta fold hydrolase [Micromonospora krabiensis]|uniref:Pimeloyl-ACP methyl ester carboxylesterase n=1 Tax=Micromonospora krabiensis TaxID=307121 RepID=A0A1C3N185_9ACTN|nr:alpha/beta hydrolase [Micromonospora krabiensis]SBV26318.1 Pimeloyl-ACP methyl ester carboxylesterase [Micromonospora krabiensis]